MARIGSYPIDAVIQDKDAWIGTENTNRVTRQFTALGVAEYIDTKNVGLVFVGATNALVGKKGLVPAPIAGDEGKYLKGGLGDGWTTIPVYTLDVPTGTTNVNLINTDGAGVVTNSFITLTGGTYLTSVHTSGSQITINHNDTVRTNPANPTPTPGAGTTLDLVSAVASNATGHVTGVTTSTVTWPADSTYTMDVPTGTTSINLAGSDGTNDPIAFTTTGANNGMTITRTDESALNLSSIWQLNTKLVEGYVPKGEANGNKFWATDANGNPFWSFQPSQDQSISSVGDSNITTGLALSQNGGTVFIRGDGSTISASSDNTNNIITLAAINRVNTTYTLPIGTVAAGDNLAKIELTDNAAIVSTVTINGTANKIAISETAGNNGQITIGMPDNVTVSGELTVSGNGQSSFIGQVTIPQTPTADTDAASKKYVDDLVSGGLTFRGTFNAATGEILSGVSDGSYLYNCPGGAGTRIAVLVGDYYIVATAGGSFYCSGVTLDIGDSIIATAAAAANASVVTGWSVVQSDEGVASFTNANGTFVSAGTVNTNATGAVTMGAIDLSAGGTASGTTFLRGDNTWATPAYVSYSAMTTSTLGLGKIKYDFNSTPDAESQSTTAARTYGVTKNASDQLVVNVPWSNTSDVNSVTAVAPDLPLSGLTSTPNTGSVIIGLDIHSRTSIGVPASGDELMIWDSSAGVGGAGQNQKVLVSDLAQYVGDGTAAANQVTYWTEANKIAGGAGFTFAGGANGTVAIAGSLTGLTSSFVSTVAGTTVVSSEGAYAGSGSVKLFEAKRNGGAVKSDWSYNESVSPLQMEIGTSTSHSFAIKTADTPRLTIDNSGNSTFSGNVLVGSGSTIYADLEVKRAGEVTVALHNSSAITSGNRGNLAFYNSSVSTVALIKAVADTDNVGTALEFYTRPVGGSLTNSMTIDSSGNVGIGVTPEAWTGYSPVLQIGDRGALAHYANDSLTMSDNWYYDGTNKRIDTGFATRIQMISATGDMHFQNAPTGIADSAITFTTRLFIQDDGNVGIGLITPGAKLDVLQEARVSYAASNQYTLRITNTDGNPRILADGSAAHLIFGTTPSGSATAIERMRINSNGTIYSYNTNNNTWYGNDAGLGLITSTGANNVVLGYKAGELITTGSRNVVIGSGAAKSLAASTTQYSVVIGYNALTSATNDSNSNVAIGDNAMGNSSGASGVIAIGQAAANSLTGDNNTVMGYGAYYGATTGTSGTIIGYQAGNAANAIGHVLIGFRAGYVNTANSNVYIGQEAGRNNTSGSANVFIGVDSGYTNVTGASNAYIGTQAGTYQTGSYNTAFGNVALFGTSGQSNASYSTALGYRAGNDITTGASNTVVGADAGRQITTGSENTAIGKGALENNTTQSKLTALGYRAGYYWTAGDENTFIGYKAGYGTAAASTGGENTLIGSFAGASSSGITGNANTSIGRFTLNALTSGSFNTALGHQAGIGITTGQSNTLVGKNSGVDLATGSRNTLLGRSAGTKITSGSDNVAIGYDALNNQVSDGQTVAIGVNALYNFVGSRVVAIGNNAGKSLAGDVDSVFIGQQAGEGRTAGIDNTFVGAYANFSAGTGCCNTGFGKATGYSLTTGVQNTFVGRQAGYAVTTTNDNTMIGHNAGINSTGAANTYVGSYAGDAANQSGSQNTGIGRAGLSAVTSGTNHTSLGYSAGDEITTGTNCTALGFAAGSGSSPRHLTTNSNEVCIGDNSVVGAYIRVAWTSGSDKRDKINFSDVPHGLDFVSKLKPTSYDLRKERDSDETIGERKYGFIAQEVLELEGINPVIIDNTDENKLAIQDSNLIPILVNAIQELKAEIEILKNK